MKFPLSLLKSFLPTKHSSDEIAEALTQIGLEVEHVEKKGVDFLFNVALTPNLAHCNSTRGIARELAALFDEKLLDPPFELKEGEEKIDSLTSVKVEAKESCPRYSCRIIQNVKVTPSPAWLQERIEACGIRPVNNIVDATNLVMAEIGQPLHAFDFDQLEGGSLVVRLPKKDEQITLIDESEHLPSDEMLLICDAKKPVAIAGVMGSKTSEVSDQTTTILLESAYFEPTQVRRTSKQTGIQSEASYRFERGVDPESVIEALDRATALITSLGGGDVAKGIIDLKATEFEPAKVACRLTQINRILGTKLAMNEVVGIFRRLDLKVLTSKQDSLTVNIPTYRHDIKSEIDLIEEVARFYGYHNLKKADRPLFRTGELTDSPAYLFEKKVREVLLRSGLTECLTCDLISPAQAEMMVTEQMPAGALLHVLNPRSQDQSVLRPSLMPGLLAAAKHNSDYGMHDLATFEIGRVYYKVKDSTTERTAASVVISGKRDPHSWSEKGSETSFFALKGIVENLLAELHIENPTFDRGSYPSLHPYRQAILNVQEMEVGVLGQLHPLIVQKAGLSTPIYFAELNLEDLARISTKEPQMHPLPTYPSTFFDWTATLKEEVSAKQLLFLVDANKPPLLESVSILDLYHGEKVGSGWKNITLRFVYRDHTKTIAHQVAQEMHQQVTTTILETLKEKAKDE